MTRALLAGLFSLLATASVHAQDATLARVDSLAAAGRLSEARSTLASWRVRHPTGSPGAGPAAHAQALFLEGRLATDAAVAIDSYLAIALAYPTSGDAPAALLRLGQGLLASGDAPRAAAYLERLTADYPRAAERPAALLWLARAHTATRRPDRACAASRTGLEASAADAEIRALLRTEEEVACLTTEAAAARAEPSPLPAPGDPPAHARFAAQTGAFRDHDSARALAQRLVRAGFDARVAILDGSALARVRIGRFSRLADAEAEAARLRAHGIETIVVDDVPRERVR
ncbi:MAG TPA: SPOR domain-containing protein [Longimicrobiales bacterium]|nr:SPOR domain-containing protein [Longimicrobiales bacterium]